MKKGCTEVNTTTCMPPSRWTGWILLTDLTLTWLRQQTRQQPHTRTLSHSHLHWRGLPHNDYSEKLERDLSYQVTITDRLRKFPPKKPWLPSFKSYPHSKPQGQSITRSLCSHTERTRSDLNWINKILAASQKMYVPFSAVTLHHSLSLTHICGHNDQHNHPVAWWSQYSTTIWGHLHQDICSARNISSSKNLFVGNSSSCSGLSVPI